MKKWVSRGTFKPSERHSPWDFFGIESFSLSVVGASRAMTFVHLSAWGGRAL